MLALNNLLAAPSFESWREGEPLDVDRLLRTGDGRPRLSVVYTAHLRDEERMFVTALLLDKVKTWMRRQGGRASCGPSSTWTRSSATSRPTPRTRPPRDPC